MCQPPGGAGLAIGAGDGEHIQCIGGRTKPLGSHQARGGLEPGQCSNFLAREAERLHTLVLDQAGRSTAHQGIAHMGAAIGRGTGPGDEPVTWLNEPAVSLQRPGDTGTQPFNGSRCGGKDLHHSDSSTTSATIWGLTSTSGWAPIMRSVCCTTSLNTGAATAPP